ncbi:MAG: hypothetical protein E7D78_10450, partial [Prevotella bivia]|nr:hypothetical protein [Prevotella bivia]
MRPARLPIPPSGLNAFLLSGAKVGIKNGLVKYLERKIVIFIEKTYDRRVNQQVQNYNTRLKNSCFGVEKFNFSLGLSF